MAHTHIIRTAYNIIVLVFVNVSRHATIVKINPLQKNLATIRDIVYVPE